MAAMPGLTLPKVAHQAPAAVAVLTCLVALMHARTSPLLTWQAEPVGEMVLTPAHRVLPLANRPIYQQSVFPILRVVSRAAVRTPVSSMGLCRAAAIVAAQALMQSLSMAWPARQQLLWVARHRVAAVLARARLSHARQ